MALFDFHCLRFYEISPVRKVLLQKHLQQLFICDPRRGGAECLCYLPIVAFRKKNNFFTKWFQISIIYDALMILFFWYWFLLKLA